MSERPSRLPACALLVVWGSRLLTLAEKVVWYHDWTLDQGGADGSYISHKSMAERLGDSLTAGTIERTRQRLKRLGLHQPLRRQDARNLGWIATLPPQCYTAKPSDAPRCAALLDHHVRQHDAWVAGEAVPPPTPETTQPWTYFVRAGDAVKIGQAWDVDRRIEGLQIGQVVKLRLLGKTRAVTERVAHRQWAHLQIRGEWFKATPALLEWVKLTCASGSGASSLDPGDHELADEVDSPVHHDTRPVDPRAAALGGRGESPFSASQSEAQLPSDFREKGVRANARKLRREGDEIERPMNAEERAALEENLAKMEPRQAAMLRRIAGL